MKKFRFVFSMLLLASFAATAQTVEPLKSWGPTFSFDGGAAVGGKIWLQETLAAVAGVNFSSAGSSSDSPDSLASDHSYRALQLGISLALQKHAGLVLGLSPYVTGGAFLNSQRNQDRSESYWGVNTRRHHVLEFGATAGVGVEYWLTRRMSITGQQLLRASMSRGVSKVRDTGNRYEQEVVGHNVGLGSSSIGLTIYLGG